ncbi:MAG: uracil phosphoribosyltransferase [Gammaproteobacteria bacterium]|nr:uracil phosphoribosyltransferase [Gammaproteobacteria bacterium]
MKKIKRIEHPLAQHSLSILRNQQTRTEAFQRHTAIVSQILIMEATRDLLVQEIDIETPLTPTVGHQILDSLVFVPVLRAGISMLVSARSFLPWAPVGFIGLERDESTASAHEYYQKFPDDLHDKHVLILDPMLATGGSLVDTIAALKKKSAQVISVVCIVSAPEGIEFIQYKYPNVQIYTAAIDSHLNEKKYIVPGLGDFGDRYFGT